MSTPKPRLDHPVSVRLTPARRAWIDAQRQPGEADSAVVARLLDEYRAVQISPSVAAMVRDLRRLAHRIEAGEISP